MKGLLQGTRPFEFKAENLLMPPEQVENFLPPATPNYMDLAAIAVATQELAGTEVKLEGLVGAIPFEISIEQEQIKLEGLSLTQAQLDLLVDRLHANEGVSEVKIEAFVDGRPVEFKAERNARGTESKLEGLINDSCNTKQN